MFTESTLDDHARRVRREIIVWGYFLGLIACILLFGFRIAVPIFLVAFLRFQAGASWRSALIYGGAGALAMYVLFEKVLRVSLHAGFLTDFIVDTAAAPERAACTVNSGALPTSLGRSVGGDVRPEETMSKGASRTAKCLSLAGGLMAASIAMPALAQGGADYFKGKTVTYIVATAAGGGYDLYGRLVAEYMQRYLPGSTFVVRNLPGAGHLVGANTIYASRADGLTIGTFNTGLIYNQLVGLPGMKFDLTKMSWIGKATTEPRAIVIAQQSPIKTFADLQASQGADQFRDLRRRQRELCRDHDADQRR